MFLELHDNDPPTLMGVHRTIEYLYQAEMVLDELAADVPKMVRAVLFSSNGIPVRQWARGLTGRMVPCPISDGTEPDPRSLAPRGSHPTSRSPVVALPPLPSPVTVGGIDVLRKHEPTPCSHCGHVLDGCCGPSLCPRCGNPRREALNR